jgi:hypothetical protein
MKQHPIKRWNPFPGGLHAPGAINAIITDFTGIIIKIKPGCVFNILYSK